MRGQLKDSMNDKKRDKYMDLYGRLLDEIMREMPVQMHLALGYTKHSSYDQGVLNDEVAYRPKWAVCSQGLGVLILTP